MTDLEMIVELQRRGYIVQRKSEFRRSLSWHHTEPVENFEDKALANLREQLRIDHIRFEHRHPVGFAGAASPTIRSAFLDLA